MPFQLDYFQIEMMDGEIQVMIFNSFGRFLPKCAANKNGCQTKAAEIHG